MTQPDGNHKNDRTKTSHPTNWPDAAINIVAILAFAAIVLTCIWSRA